MSEIEKLREELKDYKKSQCSVNEALLQANCELTLRIEELERKLKNQNGKSK